MIDATQKKLREAHFFIQKLLAESEAVVPNEREAFQFYLSAFLSAARSITFALRCEEEEKYDNWVPSWFAIQSESDQKLCKFMVTQRNVEQKQGGAKVSITWEFIPMIEVKTGHRGHLDYYGFHYFGPPGVPPPRVGVPVYSFKLGNNEGEVTATCKQYLDCLERLVRDFIHVHSA